MKAKARLRQSIGTIMMNEKTWRHLLLGLLLIYVSLLNNFTEQVGHCLILQFRHQSTSRLETEARVQSTCLAYWNLGEGFLFHMTSKKNNAHESFSLKATASLASNNEATNHFK